MVARRQSPQPQVLTQAEGMALAESRSRQQPKEYIAPMVGSGTAVQFVATREEADALERQHAGLPPLTGSPLEVGAPLPKSMGRCADLYNDVRQLRLAMDKEVEAVKARESEIREYIISNLSKSADTGAAGLRYRAQIVMKDSPRATDWQALWGYIAKNNRFDLLQKRLGEKAVMDTLADNVRIPGVEVVHVPDVSITKI